MTVHAVFISSKTTDGATIDKAIRACFADVYRVGTEFWLVDTARDADQVVAAVKPALGRTDKMFVGALTRDAVPVLSAAAHLWLTSPARTWRERSDGRGLSPTMDTPLALAA